MLGSVWTRRSRNPSLRRPPLLLLTQLGLRAQLPHAVGLGIDNLGFRRRRGLGGIHGLDKLAGDQVDLLVNGQCVAKGDVVVIDDNFGIRITEILQKPDINVLTQG